MVLSTVDLEDLGLVASFVRLEMSLWMELEASEDSGLDIVGDAELPGLVNEESESTPVIDKQNNNYCLEFDTMISDKSAVLLLI